LSWGRAGDNFRGEDVTVHNRFKSATADLHVEVESTLDLDKVTTSAAAYSKALGILYLVFDRAYKELAAIDFQPLKIDLGSIGRRRDWLATDLHALATALPAPQSRVSSCRLLATGSAVYTFWKDPRLAAGSFRSG
jgi:heme oxygenase